MDGNVVHQSRKVSKSLFKKGSRKKAKDISAEVQKDSSEDDSTLNAGFCLKVDLSEEDQFGSNLTSPKQSKLNDEEAPEDFSFFDARQQVKIEEQRMKEHLAE